MQSDRLSPRKLGRLQNRLERSVTATLSQQDGLALVAEIRRLQAEGSSLLHELRATERERDGLRRGLDAAKVALENIDHSARCGNSEGLIEPGGAFCARDCQHIGAQQALHLEIPRAIEGILTDDDDDKEIPGRNCEACRFSVHLENGTVVNRGWGGPCVSCGWPKRPRFEAAEGPPRWRCRHGHTSHEKGQNGLCGGCDHRLVAIELEEAPC